MRIGIGSTNPVKVNAAVAGMSHFMKIDSHISLDVDSDVSVMPFGDDMVKGAIARARNAIGDLDYGLGLEGGVEDTPQGMFLSGWVAIIDRDGKIGLGRTESILLPEIVAERVRKGGEVGPIMDELTGISDIKKKTGAVGYLTKDNLTRQAVFEHAVIAAMARFAREEMYI